jgi:hypothetical protein
VTVPPDRAVDRLAALERRVEDTEALIDGVTRERQAAQRALSAARAERSAYHERVGAGEVRPDTDEEARLDAAVTEATRRAEADVWEAREAGVRRLVEQRRQEAADYLAASFDQVGADLVDEDEKARRALQDAHDQLARAEEAYASRLRAWARLADRYGVVDADDLPPLPTRGAREDVEARFAAGVEPPTPRSIAARLAAVAAS